MHEISNWIQHTKRVIRISCEVVVFLLCETAIWVRIIVIFRAFSSGTHLFNDTKGAEKLLLLSIFSICLLYVLLFGPLINLLNHLLLIHHIIRKVSVNVHFSFQITFITFETNSICRRRTIYQSTPQWSRRFMVSSDQS